LRKKGRKLVILVVAVLLPHLLLTSAPASGQFEFGSEVRPATTGEVLIVEDFTSAPGIVQWPVTMMYLDVGTAPGFYDENDPLYLHVGLGPVRLADVRLTYSSFGPAGSKVNEGDGDFGINLTPFAPPYPRLVYADLGGVIGQYDPIDSIYVKAVPPISQLAAGDARLTWAGNLPPGTMVRGFDPDAGLTVRLLHPGPDFSLWSPAARGQVRFYNTNGNVFSDQLSIPIYDASDRVYFDTSAPSDPPRLFGYVAVPTPESLTHPEPTVLTGSIGDFVWKDLNSNGIQDEGEPGIPNATVKLCYEDDEGNCSVIDETKTDISGYYIFRRLNNGSYTVIVDLNSLPEGWKTPTIFKAGDDESVDSNAELAVKSCCCT